MCPVGVGPAPPGLAACVGVIVSTVLALFYWVHVAITSTPKIGWTNDLWVFIPFWIVDPKPPAIAVASVWAVLALDRRWRPEPAWLDRLGRILGTYWLADAVGDADRDECRGFLMRTRPHYATADRAV